MFATFFQPVCDQILSRKSCRSGFELGCNFFCSKLGHRPGCRSGRSNGIWPLQTTVSKCRTPKIATDELLLWTVSVSVSCQQHSGIGFLALLRCYSRILGYLYTKRNRDIGPSLCSLHMRFDAYSVSKRVTCHVMCKWCVTLRYVSGAPTRSSQMIGNKHQLSSTTTGSSLRSHGYVISSVISRL